jgi:U3 small nucleolar RNA-associated protein 14
MRYLLITYLRQPGGQIDEQVGFSKKLKPRDLQTCNVIIDYKERKVQKCIIEGSIVPTSFENLHEYYKDVYPSLIEQLEKVQSTEPESKDGQ